MAYRFSIQIFDDSMDECVATVSHPECMDHETGTIPRVEIDGIHVEKTWDNLSLMVLKAIKFLDDDSFLEGPTDYIDTGDRPSILAQEGDYER